MTVCDFGDDITLRCTDRVTKNHGSRKSDRDAGFRDGALTKRLRREGVDM